MPPSMEVNRAVTDVRDPAVAGSFYPSDPQELRAAVRGYLMAADEARSPPLQSSPAGGDKIYPKAIIAPHAGYRYSGPVAAAAYVHLRPGRDRIRRVAILGPTHRVPVRKLALPRFGAFATPLGTVQMDRSAWDELEALRSVEVLDAAHLFEHCLEVHLPFLQEVLGDSFSIVPLLVGEATAVEASEVIRLLWGGPESFIVVSSDLSHFHNYDTARQLDGETSRAIESLKFEEIAERSACGRVPIQGLLMEASRRGVRVRIADLRNSGDTSGNRTEVVGYGAYVLEE
jgi:AmmeMemoRadiSam system protein B